MQNTSLDLMIFFGYHILFWDMVSAAVILKGKTVDKRQFAMYNYQSVIRR